jgi:hypothetical protein
MLVFLNVLVMLLCFKVEKKHILLFRRILLVLGEVIFKGNFIDRRKETQNTFPKIFSNEIIEKLNKRSRKQKFISYNRIKIGLTKPVYQNNIRGLIQCGLINDVLIVLVKSGY